MELTACWGIATSEDTSYIIQQERLINDEICILIQKPYQRTPVQNIRITSRDYFASLKRFNILNLYKLLAKSFVQWQMPAHSYIEIRKYVTEEICKENVQFNLSSKL